MCEISSFSSANIDHFWKCMNSRENDMARFYRYSSSLKWSEQMTFPMDQVCGENPDNHSFLAITIIYILWRKLDQYYKFPDYSQLIAINSYFDILDKWSLCNEALCWLSFQLHICMLQLLVELHVWKYLIHSQSTRIWGLEGGGAHWGVRPMNYNAHLCKKVV